MTNKELPQTDSIQELARFWDSHDLTEFEDELEEVNEPVFEHSTAVRIQLRPDQVEAVKRMAHAKGVGYTDLIREWVDEKVHGS